MKGCIISIKVNHLCLKYSIRTADISHIVEQKYKKHCALSYRVKNPGIEPVSPVSPALQADSLPLSHQRSP